MLFENTKQRLSGYHGYPPGTEEILVFDRYDDISSKDENSDSEILLQIHFF